MFKKYMVTAWRNLTRNRSFSIINISGLAIGMAATMLITLWMQNELTFDRAYTHTDRLYQVFSREAGNGKASAWSSTPDPLAPALKAKYADIEEAVRVFESEALVTVNEKHIKSTGVFADPGFISMFDFPVLKGSPVLQEVNYIVLTEGLALRLFGTTDVIGKSVRVDTADHFIVSAVLRKLPSNTRFRFEYVLPSAYAEKLYGKSESWTGYNVKTYVLLKKGANADAVNEKIKYVAYDHLDREDQEAGLTNFLYPAKRWHLYDKPENGQMVGGQIERVKLFGWIAALIILIACINFTNLSTARSEKRAREVGVRKVIGANRNSLIVQFIAESVVLAFIAGLVAIALAHFSLPWYNQLLHTDFSLSYHLPAFWLSWMAFVLITGLLAGSYPAFFLSSFNAAVVLKGGYRFSGRRITPRKALVVLQFTFAVTLIISTLVIRKQIKYAEERDTGFDKGRLVFSPLTDETRKHYSALKQDLLNSGAVTAVTRSLVPVSADWTSNMWGYQWPGSTPDDSRKIFDAFSTDADFVKTLGTKLVAGRDIDIYNYPADSAAVLLNETAAAIMKIHDPAGQTVKRGDDEVYHVVGIIKDFVIGSPYQNVRPMIVMGPKYGWYRTIHYKLNPQRSAGECIGQIQAVFKHYTAYYPFEYRFADDAYADKFRNEQTVKLIANIFAALAIFISCLGLFGLAAYMAESRVKEIGIRKVLGASSINIATLLSADAVKLVVVAIVVSIPVAWWFMSRWLQNYEYRTTLSGWIFLFAGLLVLLIAILTVGYQSVRAALANPVKSLRAE